MPSCLLPIAMLKLKTLIVDQKKRKNSLIKRYNFALRDAGGGGGGQNNLKPEKCEKKTALIRES